MLIKRYFHPYVLLYTTLALLPQARAQDGVLSTLRQADQADRQVAGSPDRDEALLLRDAERRRQVRELLDADAVTSADDLDAAALIFQHGTSPDDWLVARELAIVASAAGNYGSLAALAHDRWLLGAGDRQRFGSQWKDGRLLPVDERGDACVTDALRADVLVPPLAVSREKGMAEALASSQDALHARIAQRADAAWREQARQSATSRRLAALAAERGGGRSTAAQRREVLDLVRADGLGDRGDYLSAARVLMDSRSYEDVLLATELAMVAAMRGEPGAGRAFAEAWDRACLLRNRAPRYGTRPGQSRVAPSVPPVVLKSFGLNEAHLASTRGNGASPRHAPAP